jgi:hypothetical protein
MHSAAKSATPIIFVLAMSVEAGAVPLPNFDDKAVLQAGMFKLLADRAAGSSNELRHQVVPGAKTVQFFPNFPNFHNWANFPT